MSTALAKKTDTWPDLINAVQPKFNEIAQFHKLVLWKAESQFAIQAIQKSKELALCAPYTVQNAIINVASVGLTLNPADGFAYLVPEYNKDTAQKECQLRISFKGLMKVATDSGAVQWVKSDVVKQNDTYTNNGMTAIPTHTKDSFGDRGETIGVYCVAKLHTDEYMTDEMSISEINKVRQCAKFDTIWKTWPDEMAKKAVIKRASKQWIKTNINSTLNAAVHLMNETEGSDPNYLLFTPEQEEHFNQLVEDEDAFLFMAFTQGLDEAVYRALFDANKEPLRGTGKMTERSALMNKLNSDGLTILRQDIEDTISNIESGDYAELSEMRRKYDAAGIKSKWWDALDAKQQDKMLILKDEYDKAKAFEESIVE